MGKVVECDYVVMVLTLEYVKSFNCMYELSIVVDQPDWHDKAMLLVIDETIYDIHKKVEIYNYWQSKKKDIDKLVAENMEAESLIEAEQIRCNLICRHLETVLNEISRIKNPTQIAIVNEIVRKCRNDDKLKKDTLLEGEQAILEILSKLGNFTVKELSDKMNVSTVTVERYIADLDKRGKLKCIRGGKNNDIKVLDAKL